MRLEKMEGASVDPFYTNTGIVHDQHETSHSRPLYLELLAIFQNGRNPLRGLPCARVFYGELILAIWQRLHIRQLAFDFFEFFFLFLVALTEKRNFWQGKPEQ